MHETFASFVARYGYGFLFIVVGIESFGIPLPGETALVTGAALAALGRLNIYGVVAAAAAGAILGDNAGYWLGRKGGPAVVHRYGRYVGLDDRKIERVHAFFARHGAKTVFIGRFVALLRSWAAALAGVGCMTYGTFTLYNALGGVVWASVFGALGYAFGRNLPRLEGYLAQASLAAALLVALVAVLALAGRWFAANRAWLAERATALWQRAASSPRLAAFRQRHARLWTFAAARFERGEYLGLHLTIGLVVSLAALGIFGGVTEDVVNHDPLTLFDVTLADWMHAHATPMGYRIFEVVSLVGSPVVLAVLAAAVAVVLARRREWLVLSGWAAAFVGAGVLSWALKQAVHRPRPLYAAVFLYDGSFSFPSGHSVAALVGYGMLAYLLVTFVVTRLRAKLGVIAGAAALV